MSLARGRWISIFNYVHHTQRMKTLILTQHFMLIIIASNGERTFYKNIFFLKYRIKYFSSEEISAQVSFFSHSQELRSWHSMSHSTQATVHFTTYPVDQMLKNCFDEMNG